MSWYSLEVIFVGFLIRCMCSYFAPAPVLQSIGYVANEDYGRMKEEISLFHNPDVINGSAAITQPPLFVLFMKMLHSYGNEQILFPALELLAFLIFLVYDSFVVDDNPELKNYPLSTFIFAINPFSVVAYSSRSIGIFSVIINALTFVGILSDCTVFASVLCAIGCYLSIYPGYLIVAVLANCRCCKWRMLASLLSFALTCGGLLYATFLMENSWGFLEYAYLSNIFALNTTPNLGLFWYMYVEMFPHFNVFFVWTMQLIIFGLCFGLLLRFYNDPPFLALVIAMTTGVLCPYNSVSHLGCCLALMMHWRGDLIYFRNGFILCVLMVVALVLAPLFFTTWLQMGTSNANFYFSASLILGVVRVQLLTQMISAHLRKQFHDKFGVNPRLSTGAKIVPSIRS